MKQVAVLGLGDFGVSLVRQLKQNKVSVFAVDINRSRVEGFRDELEHLMIADITQGSALEKLRLDTMDAVVVATSSPLPSSVLAVLKLKEMGVKRIIAKAENEDHAKILNALGVTEVVNPDEDSASRLANKISWANVVEMIELSSGFSIMEVSPPVNVIGKTLRHSGLRDVYHVEVLALREQPRTPMKGIPSPDEVISAECTMVVFGEDGNLARLRQEAERRGSGG
jgi:trk system potassium uptake protein TrkA